MTPDMGVPECFSIAARPLVDEVIRCARLQGSDDRAAALLALRTALRRLRTLWWAFAPLVDAKWQARADQDEFKRLAGVAGEVRNWDVLGELLTSNGRWRPVGEELISTVSAQRLNSLTASQVHLQSTDIETGMRQAMDSMREQLDLHADHRIGTFAEARVKLAEKKLKLRVRTALRQKRADFEAFNDVRIAGKRLRHLLEIFEPVLEGRHRKLIKRLVRFQRKLGNLNDLVVSEVLVRGMTSLGLTEDDLQQTLHRMAKQKKKMLRAAQRHLHQAY